MRISNRNHFTSLVSIFILLATTATISSSSVTVSSIESRCGVKLSTDSTDIQNAALDFGNITHNQPMAVLRPTSVGEISCVIKFANENSSSGITIAASGKSHSLMGQSQTKGGIVISMKSFAPDGIQVNVGNGEVSYVDVSGGELWINVVKETLKHGLSPVSWTDYLDLTVGGTLSNAGISGQAFLHGPQISNVLQLDVITGKGEVITCSDDKNEELFYGVLGGLGQFGIITRARILIKKAPKMVKWITATYTDILSFNKDQEYLISIQENPFDYVEGFVKIRTTTSYILEVAKYYNPEDFNSTQEVVGSMLSNLTFIKSSLSIKEVNYIDFLYRVHESEVKLGEKGLWEVPHPWINLLIPKSKIHEFTQDVFGKIVLDNTNWPLLFYPLLSSKWDKRTSAVIPNEEIFYAVSLLISAVGSETAAQFMAKNQEIIDLCKQKGFGAKQYLGFHNNQDEWIDHFGEKWEAFKNKKTVYDPTAILSPGQGIFPKGSVL